MDAGLDTGPLVAVERVSLAGDETAPALEARLAIVAAGLLARSLEPWLAGELEPVPQGVEGVSLTRPLRRADGRPRSGPAGRAPRAPGPGPPAVARQLRRDRRRSPGRAGRRRDHGGADDVPGRFVPDQRGLALATTRTVASSSTRSSRRAAGR